MNTNYVKIKKLLMLVLFVLICTSTYAQRGVRAIKAVEKVAKEINIKTAREIKMGTHNAEKIERSSNKIERQYNNINNVGTYRRPLYPKAMPSKTHIPTKAPVNRSHRKKTHNYSTYRVVPYAVSKGANAKIIQCPACRGKGKNYYGNTCNICGGSGLVSASTASSYKAYANNLLNPKKPLQTKSRKKPFRNICIILIILCGIGYVIYRWKS